jgi:hypothetical protein
VPTRKFCPHLSENGVNMGPNRLFRTFKSLSAVAIALPIAVGCPRTSAAEEKRPSSVQTLGQEPAAGDHSVSCAAALQTFVVSLDDLLARNPGSINPFIALLDKTFPLRGCLLAEAVNISQRSRYFAGVQDDVAIHLITFSSGKLLNGGGYYVAFALEKMTGDSRYPTVVRNRPTL